MTAFIVFSLIFLSGDAHGGSSWYSQHLEPYFNYPGFELWKFLNLGIFVALIIYILKTPLSSGFKARREEIRAELVKAEEEKQAALAQLTSAEAKLAGMDQERKRLIDVAKVEAAAEVQRLEALTASDIEKLNSQVDSDIDRLRKQSIAGLKRFSAEESIRMAEESLKQKLSTDLDANIVNNAIKTIGGLN